MAENHTDNYLTQIRLAMNSLSLAYQVAQGGNKECLSHASTLVLQSMRASNRAIELLSEAGKDAPKDA